MGKVLPLQHTFCFRNWQVWGPIKSLQHILMNHRTVTKFGTINRVAKFIFCLNLKN